MRFVLVMERLYPVRVTFVLHVGANDTPDARLPVCIQREEDEEFDHLRNGIGPLPLVHDNVEEHALHDARSFQHACKLEHSQQLHDAEKHCATRDRSCRSCRIYLRDVQT